MNRHAIRRKINAAGEKLWEIMTARCINKNIAIVFDDIGFSAPTVMSSIEGGNSEISGDFSDAQAGNMAKMMSSGYLPLHLVITALKLIGNK